MVAVATPVEGFNGVVAGVTFVDGHGETDDENKLAYFRRRGYAVTTKKPSGRKPAGGKSDEPADAGREE